MNLPRQWFAAIANQTKRIEYRRRTPHWRSRLEGRRYDVIQFRNGYSADAPEMHVEFLGVRKVRKDGVAKYAIRLGRILKLQRWKQ